MFDPVIKHLSSPPPSPEGRSRMVMTEMSSRSATARGIPFTGRSLVELLRFRARVQPNDRAFVFLRDGEHESETASYAELDRRSRVVAAELQRHVSSGARALLLYPPGLEFVSAFFGCLYAQVVAVPAFPPRWRLPDRNLTRAVAVAADAGPEVVLSTTETADRWTHAATDGTVPQLVASACGRSQRESAMHWVATDALDGSATPAWRDPGVDQDALAFLQYTSGSTDTPRGVMVSHGNLLHNLSYAFQLAQNDRSSVSVSWLPVVHDMGLIDGVLQPVFSGCPAYLMSPTAFLQRPVRWLRVISRYRATRSGAPNFAYDLCVRRISVAERVQLDLSSWRDAYNGAEPIRSDTLERFVSTFSDSGFRPTAFRPCYGLAEATLLVTSGRYAPGSSRPLRQSRRSMTDTMTDTITDTRTGGDRGVSCGRPSFGTSVIVVDPKHHRRCAEGVVGEVWVSGASVAAGYWNRPEASAKTFAARTADGAGPFLRTGDLGLIGDDGLRITGRLKDVLIVRGAKHYPQDLEQTAEGCHGAVRPGCVAAFAVGGGSSGDRIALVAEVDPHRLVAADGDHEVIAAIRSGITEVHGIQLCAVTCVGPGGVEKTTSGKVKRFACRDALLSGTLDVLSDWCQPDAPEATRVAGVVTSPVGSEGGRAPGLACP